MLDLLARGRSQAEIARDLFISPKTVATHIQHVLSKLDVHSRAQAVALALRYGPVADHAPGSHAGFGHARPMSGERSLPFP